MGLASPFMDIASKQKQGELTPHWLRCFSPRNAHFPLGVRARGGPWAEAKGYAPRKAEERAKRDCMT